MEQMKVSIDYAGKLLNSSDLAQILPDVRAAKKTLMEGTGAGNDFLGWIDLPGKAMSDAGRIADDVKRLAPKINMFAVIGIGGSYLGARAVIEALQVNRELLESRGVRVVYAGNTLNEDYYWHLLRQLDECEYAVAVISKSGTTTEPAVAFRVIKEHLEKKYGKAEASSRIIAITDESKGALHDIALQEGYRSYVIPDNVGGRFSVLTPVGLLPIAMAGGDISRLLAGAADMREICVGGESYETNPAMLYAAARNILYRKGRKVEVLVNFTPQLNYVSEWWKQLFGESEGKDLKGILPHSLSFTTDLHSLGQYVQDGERILFETFVGVASSSHHVDIPDDAKNLDGINYLVGKSLTEINHKAEEGTMQAHVDGNVPVLRVEIPVIDEYYIGQLIYFFEFACGISGYMLGVNPFNQPGVEAYKRNMFRLLGKPGYEKCLFFS